jgi:hypothetical protein
MTFQTEIRHLLILTAIGFAVAGTDAAQPVPKPPAAENIDIKELPLPPAISSAGPGACSQAVNRRRTGCVSTEAVSFQSGSFLPDGHHVLAQVRFVSAPAEPDPASIYKGDQIILIKTDGATFPNGDPWKCITCGVPSQNAIGISPALDYPQSFRDGKRALAGTNIIDCSPTVATTMDSSSMRATGDREVRVIPPGTPWRTLVGLRTERAWCTGRLRSPAPRVAARIRCRARRRRDQIAGAFG